MTQPKKPGNGRKKHKASLMGGIAWTMVRGGGVALLQILAMVFLSRLLSPKEIGWAAAVFTITNFTQLLAQMGIAPAIIRHPELTDRHLATGYLASLVAGGFQTVLVIACAPLLAMAFHMPEIEPVFRLISVVFAINAFGRIAYVRLTRDLYFHHVVKSELFSNIVYAVVAIGLAYAHWGVWSIVWGLIAQAVAQTAFLMVGEPLPRPFRFDRAAFNELMSMAKGFSAASIFGYLATQADNFVVGRWMGPAPLGLYSRAYSLTTRPVNILVISINRVLFPSMSRVQSNADQLRDMFAKTTTGMAMIVLPMGLIGAVLGPEVIHVLLGHKWDGAIVPYQILMAGFIFKVGNQSADAITRAVCSPRAIVVPKVVYFVAVASLAYAGSFWGLPGVSVGVTVANLVHSVIMGDLSIRHLGMGWGEYLQKFQTALIVGLAGAATAWSVATPLRHMHMHNVVVLIVSFVASVAVTLAILRYGGTRLLGSDVVKLRNNFTGRLRKKVRGRQPAAA